MSNPITKKERLQRTLFYTGFFLCNLILAFFYADIWMSPNPMSRALPVLSLQESGTLKIDKYKDYTGDKSKIKNHFYSDKAPLSTFAVYPAYSLYKKMGFKDIPDTVFKKYPIYIWEHVGMPDGRTFLLPKTGVVLLLGDFLCGTIPFILILLFTLIASEKLIRSKTNLALIMLAFYGSYLFVYSGTFNGHLFAGMWLFLSYYFLTISKKYLLSGIFIGLGFATEFPIAAIIPIWALQIYANEKDFKKPIYFLIGAIPGIAFILYYNHLLTGSAMQTTYSFVAHEEYQGEESLGFRYPNPTAIWGLLFSKFRGMLFYAPMLALMLIYLVKNKWQTMKALLGEQRMHIIKRVLCNYLFVASVTFICLFSAHKIWYGGWAYGPRHLIPLGILLLFEGVLYLTKNKYSNIAVLIFGGAGLFMAWIAKSTRVFMVPYNEKANEFINPFSELMLPDFNEEKLNGNNLLSLFSDTEPKTANYLWLFSFIVVTVVLTYLYKRIFKVINIPAVHKPEISNSPVTVKTNEYKKNKKHKR